MPVRCITIAAILIVYGSLASAPLRAQAVPPYNIDSARSISPGCDTVPVYAYFQVRGKYPESSQTLVTWANNALEGYSAPDGLNGYITFRVLIDCSGKLAAVKLLQTNERYDPCFFPKHLVDRLYAFLLSLKSWKKGHVEGRPVNYSAYLSFKIENGHVVQVSP